MPALRGVNSRLERALRLNGLVLRQGGDQGVIKLILIHK